MRRLFEQIRELLAHRRALRIAEYRSALRLKRAVVRSAVRTEILANHASRKRMARDLLISSSRVRVLHEIEHATKMRGAILQKCLDKAGVSSPTKLPTHDLVEESKFKSRVLTGLSSILPDSGAGSLVSDTARSAISSAEMGNPADGDIARFARLVTAMARDAGLSEKRLNSLVDSVADGDDDLRKAVRAAVEEARLADHRAHPPSDVGRAGM